MSGPKSTPFEARTPTIGPTHLLLALTEEQLSDDAAVQSIGVDLHAIRDAVESAFGAGAPDSRSAPRHGWRPWRRGDGGHKPFTAEAKKALELSLRKVIRLEAREITSEALLLGLLRTGAPDVSGILDRAAVSTRSQRSELESRIRHAA